MISYDVKVYDLVERKARPGEKRRPRPWRLRWLVDGRRFELRYATKALADSERSKLLRASRDGEGFDVDTGRPESEVRQRDQTTWFQHAREYIAMKWPHLAAKSRRSSIDALVTVTVALVDDTRPVPERDELRRALYSWAFIPSKSADDPPPELASVVDWLSRHSLPVARLADPGNARAALDACATTLAGQPAAATTTNRKRAVLYNAVGYAIERGRLEFNPIDRVQWKAPAVAEQVDRRVVANTAQVEALLAAVPNVSKGAGRYQAFFGCLYYAGMRPSEAASLRYDDCVLPEQGWGRITLVESAPYAGADYTDDGELRDVRGLKHRAAGSTRTVPIPPELVTLIREHVDEYGLGRDGRVFQSSRGGYLSSESYARVWSKARRKALTPRQVNSPLARRPYDLRHAAVTLWLNGGVAAPEVARRAGHGVAVLLKVYAGCIDGDEAHVNDRIDEALAASRSRGQAGAKGAKSSLGEEK